ncbi:Tetratricopeptide TPR_2 repeat-containing protein [Desulfotomaculum nigrificans CO-1-SRB]|uniref:Tetratricopeptide TPR_2 repeat-containing protein n=1 Tax=Desulfotomaculum nigrificans (strain DSM 14880 / VKM B-2319 / CO-1-SRB) TaxID=868595 RepID=F6B6A9_DESCC|nr:tetratricopeptide repeat protein [Desulfotomaculum nigrificans]AEF95532.1 Tetratricopeptide TPR_2 repeat-containing protein [Desulfotomaculum nigrificans CO-1-SRB]
MFKFFSPSARNKRTQRIVFGILAAVLALGLIGSSVVWSGLGGIQDEQTKVPTTVEERIKALEEQSKKKPHDTELLNALAANYTEAGKLGQAATTYEKILSLEPKNVSVMENLALIYYAQGKTDVAERQLNKALQIEPNNPDVNFQYAQLQAEKKNYQGAIAAMEKVLQTEKQGPRADEARKLIESWKAAAGQ